MSASTSQKLPPAVASEFRIFPAGVFRTSDGSGRPAGLPGWVMDARAASAIIASLAARKDDVMIDYDHRSVSASDGPGMAPAAGWFRRVEWREGDGLYAVGARWTENAAALIAATEYRDISPVFQFDKRTGAVINLVSIGLVNQPALDGLTDLATASAVKVGNHGTDCAGATFDKCFSLYEVDAYDASKMRVFFPGVFG